MQFSFILHSLHGLPVRQTASGFNLRQVYYWRRMFSERLLIALPPPPHYPQGSSCTYVLNRSDEILHACVFNMEGRHGEIVVEG